ncbi:hypothetical protein MMC18_000128 [Xylographa bjoerkii]|nr:hypothetical protein [Xylographa bjoerkii]
MTNYSRSNNVIPDATSFLYLTNHASVVLGDWVYIDGGSTTYLDSSNHEKGELLNITLAIDLRSKWTNTSVSMVGIDKAGSPILDYACLWPNAEGSAAYTFAGGVSWALYYGVDDSPVKAQLWSFTPDNDGEAPQNGLHASANGMGYYLGGFLNWGTYPETTKGYLPVPNLITYNSSSDAWQNFTASGFSSAGTASYGGAQIVPTFGNVGLVVFFGGYTTSATEVDYSSLQLGFDEIAILDSQTQTWYHQNATGPRPEWRANFCTVGVPGDNGTYEIFIYGGESDPLSGSYWVNGTKPAYPDAGMVQQELELDEIYVLSLPSFNWFKADYPAVANRNSHTCHVVGAGQRQLLSIGGSNFAVTNSNLSTSHKDIFAQGLGVFDLTDMVWLSSYDPNAPSYQTPQMVKDFVNTSPTPSSWSSPQLAQLFSKTRAISTPSASAFPKASSTPTAAIAGGVVGGVVALILLILTGWCFWRRQRRAHGAKRLQKQYALTGSPQWTDSASYDGVRMAEAPTDGEVVELVAKERPGQLQTGRSAEAWELETEDRRELGIVGELHGDMNYR